jgi:peptide/nickel transport system permease protein
MSSSATTLPDFVSSRVRRTVSMTTAVPPAVYLAALVLLFFLMSAATPQLLQITGPFKIDFSAILQPPSFLHPFGTDQIGRDMYSRVVNGARQSFAIGLGATGLGMAVALMLGMTAGLAGRLANTVIGRFLDVLFSFPTLFLALLFVTVFGPTVSTEIVAIGLGTAPGYARMIRGQVLSVRGAGYVEAAKAFGHPFPQIIWQHIIPNAMRPLVVMITLGVGQSIVWASGLAFLGLGSAPPSPEWGALLDAGRDYVTRAWWLEVMPGFAIVVFALSVTVIGRYLQARLEGRSRAV